MTDPAKAELKEIAFRILCDCEKEFRAEDFMPECPYCGRVYRIELTGDPEEGGNEGKLYRDGSFRRLASD